MRTPAISDNEWASVACFGHCIIPLKYNHSYNTAQVHGFNWNLEVIIQQKSSETQMAETKTEFTVKHSIS